MKSFKRHTECFYFQCKIQLDHHTVRHSKDNNCQKLLVSRVLKYFFIMDMSHFCHFSSSSGRRTTSAPTSSHRRARKGLQRERARERRSGISFTTFTRGKRGKSKSKSPSQQSDLARTAYCTKSGLDFEPQMCTTLTKLALTRNQMYLQFLCYARHLINLNLHKTSMNVEVKPITYTT